MCSFQDEAAGPLKHSKTVIILYRVLVFLIRSICICFPQIHYLMCLSANYAHIRDHEKFQELQELQYLQDPELSVAGSKDRF